MSPWFLLPQHRFDTSPFKQNLCWCWPRRENCDWRHQFWPFLWRPFAHYTLEPIHLNVHIEFDPGMVGKGVLVCCVSSLRKWSTRETLHVLNRKKATWSWVKQKRAAHTDKIPVLLAGSRSSCSPRPTGYPISESIPEYKLELRTHVMSGFCVTTPASRYLRVGIFASRRQVRKVQRCFPSCKK